MEARAIDEYRFREECFKQHDRKEVVSKHRTTVAIHWPYVDEEYHANSSISSPYICHFHKYRNDLLIFRLVGPYSVSCSSCRMNRKERNELIIMLFRTRTSTMVVP